METYKVVHVVIILVSQYVNNTVQCMTVNTYSASVTEHAVQMTDGIKKSKQGKAIPVTGREGPYGCETLRLPHFLDNRLTDGVRMSALCAGRPFSPGRFLVLSSVRG
jgi:hypothetical protein